MRDQLVFITSFVKEYNYPSVELMDEEELLQVFNASNRVFMLSWALSKLNFELYGYLSFNQRQKDIKNIIAKALSDHGFCYENQSMKFVDGQLEFPEEVVIIYGLFKYIDMLQRTKTSNFSETPVEPVTLDEIKELQSFTVNFFPYCVHTDKLAEQSDLSDKFMQCLKKVKNDAEPKLFNQSQPKELPNVDQLKQTVLKIDKSLRLFKHSVFSIVVNEDSKSIKTFDFDCNLPEVLNSGAEDLCLVRQLTKNLSMDVRGLGDIEIPEDKTSHISAGLTEYIDIL